jgi:hypothetical protein
VRIDSLFVTKNPFRRRFPEPLLEPLPWGMSKLDRLDRKSLLKRWEKSEHEISRIMRETSWHSEVERRFYVRHRHWPEQAGTQNVLCTHKSWHQG